MVGPGPRGKAEVGERGVAGVARKVWGKIGTERDELKRRWRLNGRGGRRDAGKR